MGLGLPQLAPGGPPACNRDPACIWSFTDYGIYKNEVIVISCITSTNTGRQVAAPSMWFQEVERKSVVGLLVLCVSSIYPYIRLIDTSQHDYKDKTND